MNNTIIHIEGISKSFSKDEKKHSDNSRFILNNLNLIVEKNKITALIGGNGTGKTTLFNIISGLVEADKGSINYYGNSKVTDLIKTKPFKRFHHGIGRLFQDNHIFEELTLLENLLIANQPFKSEDPLKSFWCFKKFKKKDLERVIGIKRIFDSVFQGNNDLWEKRNDKAKNFSYGQQRLIELLRLFVGDYKILLLDEPTAGIHKDIIESMGNIIRKMVHSQYKTVLLIEHNLSFVRGIADNCAFLNNAHIEYYGAVNEVLNNEDVKRSYLGV